MEVGTSIYLFFLYQLRGTQINNFQQTLYQLTQPIRNKGVRLLLLTLEHERLKVYQEHIPLLFDAKQRNNIQDPYIEKIEILESFIADAASSGFSTSKTSWEVEFVCES